MKKFGVLIFSILFLVNQAMAYTLDTSVDDEIRRTYDPSKLEHKLPALPKTAPSQKNVTNHPQTLPTQPLKVPPKNSLTPQEKNRQIGVKNFKNDYKYDKSTAIRIKKGTKFRVRSNNVISDYLREGNRVSFNSVRPVTQRYVTIPVGTKFYATIQDSHQPQFTGNGGLIVLMVDGMVYNGQLRNVHAKITKANLKKTFFNNIKGKHSYWRGVSTQIDKGQRFYNKTRRASNKLAGNPIGILISPVPTLTGMAVYLVNFVGSPLFAIWYKGGRISIPQGSEFEIKLLEDVYLY